MEVKGFNMDPSLHRSERGDGKDSALTSWKPRAGNMQEPLLENREVVAREDIGVSVKQSGAISSSWILRRSLTIMIR